MDKRGRAGGLGRRARGRSGGRHCTADQYGYVSLGRHLVTLAASSGERNITVWSSSVRPSVPFFLTLPNTARGAYLT